MHNEPVPPALIREVLLSFFKVHILHHAEQRPVHGRWIIHELREHGYDISPGTLYPLLSRLVERGWLAPIGAVKGSSKARRDYRLTKTGRAILRQLRRQVEELHREVVRDARR